MSDLAYEASIDPRRRSDIEERLTGLERDHNVRLLFAIESGSRAWGFPSPDSDYDVRFVYAHPVKSYLSVFDRRDVIELPIEGDLDINGWDIRKAINLLLKPNPVLLEWLSSPVHYRWNDKACSAILQFAAETLKPSECVAHYYHLALRQWERNIQGETSVNLKKYFYVLRPALAIRWVRTNPDKLPPMNFQSLVAGTEIDAPLCEQIGELLRAKALASEVGEGARIPELDSLIEAELSWARNHSSPKHISNDSERASADQLFRTLIECT